MSKKLISPVLLAMGLVLCGLYAINNQASPLLPPQPGALTIAPALPLSVSQLRPVVRFSSIVVSSQATINSIATISPTSITLPTYYSRIDGARAVGNTAVDSDGRVYPLRSYEALAIPNDPRANQSWVASSNLSAGWDIPRGSTPTLLAIIDTGVALNHEELRNRFYTNQGETGPTTQEGASLLNCSDRGLALDKSCNLIGEYGNPYTGTNSGPTTLEAPSQRNCSDRGLSLNKNCNRLDDDGNGLIDDVRGYDFADGKASVQAGEISPNGVGTHHGTYVTGVAAASGNNGVGIAGVDWGTTILPIQALTDSGSGNTVGVANAINYAVSQRANVISLSLGSTYDDWLVHAAVRRAVAAGIIVVAAAGNGGCDCMTYPANYPEVISVGAADSNGQPAAFSSYGANLKILAPGVNLYTTDWQAGNQTAAYASGISGTSLATPIVAGLLTRLLSQQPSASPMQLVAAITESTNRTGLSASSARSDSFGYGVLDIGRASQRINTSYAPVQLYSFGAVSRGAALSGLLYDCPSGTVGSTPIYKLINGDSVIFTASIAEDQLAQEQGSSSSLFSYACVTQPQDAPQLTRTINVLSEFFNQLQTK